MSPRRICLSLVAAAALVPTSAAAAATPTTVTLKPTSRTAKSLSFTAHGVALDRVKTAKLRLATRRISVGVTGLRSAKRTKRIIVVKVKTTKSDRTKAKLQLTLKPAAATSAATPKVATPAATPQVVVTPVGKSAPAAPSTPATPAANTGNIPVGLHGSLRFRTGADLETAAQKMQDSGVTVDREDFSWASVETTPGTYDWSSYDAMVAAAARHGLRILAVPGKAPTWAAPTMSIAPTSGPNLVAFTAFIRAAIQRYGSNGSFWAANPDVPKLPIEDWDIWNEPYLSGTWGNSTTPDPIAYGTMFRDVVSSVKSVDPQASFMLDTENGMWVPGKGWTSYLGAMLDGVPGLAKYVDALSVHTYTENPDQCTSTTAPAGSVAAWTAQANDFCRLQQTRAILDAHSMQSTKIWITETGFSTAPGSTDRVTNEAGQASGIKTEFQDLRKWRIASGVIFFNLQDATSPDASNREDYFGLVHGDWSPKPAWSVFVDQVQQGVPSAV